MTLFVMLLTLVSSAFAAESAIQRGALLVLPQGSNSSSTTTTTTTPAPQSDNSEELNALVMELLRQQAGSEGGGVYHVYLPDGRLQRVQYTTAPINSQTSVQDSQTSENLSRNRVAKEGLTITPQAVYYVQVPADCLQSIKFPEDSRTPNNTQANNISRELPALDPRYRQSPDGNSKPTRGPIPEYLPITVLTVEQLRTSRNNASSQSQEGKQTPQVDMSSQRQTPGRQVPSASRYVASIQYSDVEPIPAPIYSYSPSSLVRILRYAP